MGIDTDKLSIYFSRSIITEGRKHELEEWLRHANVPTPGGLYAYRAEVLERLGELPQSPLELAESLEQLRCLQA